MSLTQTWSRMVSSPTLNHSWIHSFNAKIKKKKGNVAALIVKLYIHVHIYILLIHNIEIKSLPMSKGIAIKWLVLSALVKHMFIAVSITSKGPYRETHILTHLQKKKRATRRCL